MQAGPLRSIVTVLKLAAGRDAAGQRLPDNWVPHCRARANILHQSGAAAIKGDGEASVVRVSIRIHYRADITAAMRVREGPDTYQIDAVLPDKVRRKSVDLTCSLIK